MLEAQLLKEKCCDNLISQQGVTGVGVGHKWSDGVPVDYQPAIIVFVEKKYTKSGVTRKFSAGDIIPETIDGIPTDVIEVGKIVKQDASNFRNRVRPVKPGYSCGHGSITAGTIGGFFLDSDNDPVILSNNHVIANENKGRIGDIIYQPGPSDAIGTNLNFRGWDDPVSNLPYMATLKRFTELKKNGNIHDSAVAKIHPKYISGGMIDPLYPTINKSCAGFGTASIAQQVQKCGRTTGYTTGRVIATKASFTVGYDFGQARFNDCVVLSAMSKGGDSVGPNTMLYYKVDGELKYSSISEMYGEVEVERWIDDTKFIPKKLIEVLSVTDTSIYNTHYDKSKTPTECIWRKVNWLYKHWTDKKLFKLWTRDHREIIITEDHSLFGKNSKSTPNRRFLEMSGKDISIGTRLLVPSTLSSVGDSKSTGLNKKFLTIIGLFLGDGSFERNNIRTSISCGGNLEICEYLRSYIESEDEFKNQSQLVIAAYKSNIDVDRKEFCLTNGIAETNFYNAISRYKAGKTRNHKICYMNKKGDVKISNWRFTAKLLSYGLHNGFATKEIPSQFMTASIDDIKAILCGLFSSDGGIKFKKGYPPSIAFGVHNKKLAEQCRTLLWRVGIECSISHENTNRNTAKTGYKASCDKSYRVIIASIDSIKKFIDEIGLIGHTERVVKARQQIERFKTRNHYELTSKIVRGIEEQFIKQPVYDLSVEGEKFIADGFVCHNSGSLIFDMSMNAVAQLFAGSPKVTIASPIQPIIDAYGLKMWCPVGVSGAETLDFDDTTWRQITTNGKIERTDGHVTITAAANQFCFIESEIGDFNSVSVVANTGSDLGASWGPSLTVQWPNSMLKVNLRHGDRFGGYFNGTYNISIGSVKPNTDYTLRIRKSNSETFVGEIMDGDRWFTVIELPRSIFPNNPISVRVGKTDELGQSSDHSTLGEVGTCSFSNFTQT